MPLNESIDPIRLEIFRHMLASIADEMGTVLGRSAHSTNIRERKDYSCALFNRDGETIAHAAHIPVHLGAMPLSVQQALQDYPDMASGDVIILNDPYRGGTHLPDVTLIAPVFVEGSLAFFVANRAHQSDIGGASPGSMPLATEIFQEGLIIPPVHLYRSGRRDEDLWQLICANVRTPKEREGDLMAQLAAIRIGERRLQELCARYGLNEVYLYSKALLDYAEKFMDKVIRRIPKGIEPFEDIMDDDGINPDPVKIKVTIIPEDEKVYVDFTGSSPATRGSINAVYAVTLSAVRYCFRCLIDEDVPENDGLFRPLRVIAPPGTVVNAQFPAAVSSGNVETSQRIVDTVFGALAKACPDLIPAASCGTMSNFTFGGVRGERTFAFYETIAGGAGATPKFNGESAIQTHMTNTMNTPIEAIEMNYPVRIRTYRIRKNSGGTGRQRGGDGIIREFEFLQEMQVSLMADRHRNAPYGLFGGEPGSPGQAWWIKAQGDTVKLPSKFVLQVNPGDRIRIETPGGGGWGTAQ